MRYSILKWYYALFVKKGGYGTIFKPIFFEFPYDESVVPYDWEFMVGEALLAAPVLFSGD